MSVLCFLVMNNQEAIMVTAGVAGVEALVAHITGLPSGEPYKKSIKSIQKKKSIRALEH